MLDVLRSQSTPLAVATIYDGVPGLDPGLRTALAAFNDVILREAAALGLPVLDLGIVCSEPGDYAAVSPIGPPVQDGCKIACAIAQLVCEQNRDAHGGVHRQHILSKHFLSLRAHAPAGRPGLRRFYRFHRLPARAGAAAPAEPRAYA